MQRSHLIKLLGIDLRSLAFFRVAIALVVLNDVFARIPDLTVFYSDAGVLPRAEVFSMHSPYDLSVYFMAGSAVSMAILFLLHALSAVGLLAGFRTRLMVFLCWLFTISIQDRNPLVMMGGADAYLRLLLFWGMFLPLGQRFSLDAALNPRKEQDPPLLFNLATSAILLQCVIVYLMTSAQKWSMGIWRDGTAVSYVLNNEIFAKSAAQYFLQFPALLTGLTYVVPAFEFFGPVLLFCPWGTGLLRTLTVLGFIFMHTAFFVCIDVEFFQFVSIAALLLFLPAWFWDTLVPQARSLFVKTGGGVPDGLLKENPLPARGPAVLSALISWLKRFERPRSEVKVVPAWLTSLIILLFFTCVVSWNAERIMPSRYRMPKISKTICSWAHLGQGWRMFVDPLQRGWFVVAGTLRNGAEVELLNDGSPLTWEKPELISKHFKNERWRKFLFRLLGNRRAALDYGIYLCRSWNSSHAADKKLESLQIVLISKPTPEKETTPFRKHLILEQDCRSLPPGKQ